MSLRWKLRAHDADIVETIERSAGVSPVVAQILALRGITKPARVNSFLDLRMKGLRPPEDLPGLVDAVEVISDAIDRNQNIVIYGDYDCDGMTSTSIMQLTLEKLGANVSHFVPDRMDDGYGVSIDQLTRLAGRGANLVITVDCGIKSVEHVEHAKSLGVDMVISDHHQFGEKIPDARAVVHPALPSANYPFHGLCGAGVAFKLAWGLCKKRLGSEKLPPDYRELLFRCIALAAIGTVADVVPLLDENRLIVHHGLMYIRNYGGPGLNYLLEVCDLHKKEQLESDDIGFKIGPRLNAAGRLTQAKLAVELLTTHDTERIRMLGDYLNSLNGNRKTIERRISTQAKKQIEAEFDPANEPGLVIAGAEWPKGVIGIVAGRIAETYHRPTVLISLDAEEEGPVTGSCRSACGVNLYQALEGCRDLLVRFGGHAGAAGLTIERENIDAFREAFCHRVTEQVGIEELNPELEIDAEALLCQMTLPAMKDLEKLAPFGHDNPRPTLCCTGVRLSAPPKTMGDGSHISLQLIQENSGIRAVGFGKSDWLKQINDEGIYDFAFRPVINNFKGRRKVELQLVDFRPSGSDK